MSYLVVFIAIFVLGTLAYPILQLVPSKQQKFQVAFRQAAMQKGIQVQIRQPANIPTVLLDQYPQLAKSVAYFKPASNLLNKCYTAIRSNNGHEWFWLHDQRPPAAMMGNMLSAYSQLPDFCLAVEQSPAGSAIFLLDTLAPDQVQLLDFQIELLNKLIKI